MTFKLANSPLQYVVATFGIEKHPDLQRLANRSFEELKMLGLDGYDSVIVPSIKVQPNLPPQLVNIEQRHFFDNDYSKLLIIQDNGITVATSDYLGFEAFSEFLSKLLLILEGNEFPNVISSTYRYVNEFSVKQLPTNLIKMEFQGDVSLWQQSSHIHLDSKLWIDIDGADNKELWLTIKGSKKHVATADNMSSLPRKFTSKTGAGAGDFGLAIDLWHNSKGLKMRYDHSLLKVLDSQREKIKEIFESLLTHDSRLLWEYEKITKA